MFERKGYGIVHLVVAFLGGAAAGAGIALFAAPRSGAETRKRLRDLIFRTTEEAERIPHALRQATTAAAEAFTQALHEAPAVQHH